MNPLLRIATVALLVAACTPATGDLGGVATPPPSDEPSIALPSDEPTPGQSAGPVETPGATQGTSTGTTTIRAYFFLGSFTDNAGLVPVLREISKTKAVGTAAMTALLAGPNDAELGARPAMYTDIPADARFLGLTIEAGRATVNVSKEFASGGGSASVRGRLAVAAASFLLLTLEELGKIRSAGAQPAPRMRADLGAPDRSP